MRLPGVRRRPDSGCLPSSRSDPSCTKRRFQADDEGPAVKLHMSEDVVSARLQLLSLENDHSYGGNGLPKISPRQQGPDIGSPDSGSDDDHVVVDPGEFSMSGCHVICPILEETLKDPEPRTIVPESLLHSLSSPCLDLVLWSPPSGPIHQLLRSLSGVEEGSREQTVRKNQRDTEEGMEL